MDLVRTTHTFSPSLILACIFVLGGCAKACGREHPYVPYAVGDAPSASASAIAAPVIDAGTLPPSTAGEPALVAPPGTTVWRTEGLELHAPQGRELLLAIIRDVDGDGKKDALAIARAPAPPNKPSEAGAGEILFYRGGDKLADPLTIAVAPPPRTDTPCTPLARLERIGARSALVELGSTCTRGAATRALYVVRLSKSPAVAFDLAIADPASAPKLGIEVEAEDRDKDGLDDVAMKITIEGGSPPFEPGPKLSAKLAFFDRPAGASRDPDEPDASLKILAASAVARANKAKTAPEVPAYVAQMRMLYRAMCAEGGAPRLAKLRNTGGIACGTSRPLEDAGVAEVKAFVAMGDAIRALSAADLAQGGAATRTAAKTTELGKLLAEVAPILEARTARTLATTVASKHGPHPVWGPLAFEPSGKLLVRNGTKVVRVDPDSGEEEATEIPAWPEEVISPDGKSRWLEAYHACEGVALRATFVPIGDADVKDVLLPIAPALGTRCPGTRGEPAPAVPIAWTASGLEAIVAGQPLLIKPEVSVASILASPLDQPPAQGSPRAPGGKAIAIVHKSGVLVRLAGGASGASGGRTSFRAHTPQLEPYDDLRGCTVTDDGKRIACDRRGKVVAASFDP